jgi:hypothetical protein
MLIPMPFHASRSRPTKADRHQVFAAATAQPVEVALAWNGGLTGNSVCAAGRSVKQPTTPKHERDELVSMGQEISDCDYRSSDEKPILHGSTLQGRYP